MTNITSVSQERITKPDVQTPVHPEVMMDNLDDRVRSMRNEATGPMWAGALARVQLRKMAANSPEGLRWGSDVHCHGAGVSMGGTGDVKAYYLHTTTGARSPESHHNQTGEWPEGRAVQTGGGQTTTIVVTSDNSTGPKGVGRARGYNGWDDTGDLIVGVLASFQHNFEGLLLGYAERPSLPSSTDWHLPNLVHSTTIASREDRYNASISEPDQFVPSASYSYSLAAPVPAMTVMAEVKADEDSKGYVQIMDSAKNEVAVTKELNLPAGTTKTTVNVVGNPFALRTGYVNINPSDAPAGLTVSSVTTTPPPV